MPNDRPPRPAGPSAAATHAASNGETSGTSPLRWVPAGFKLETLSQEQQKALAEVVNPSYEDLVRRPRDGLERSTGITHLYLLWAEMLLHFQVAASYSSDRADRMISDYDRLLMQYIDLAKQKAKTTNLLIRLRQLAQKCEAQDRPHVPLDTSPVIGEMIEFARAKGFWETRLGTGPAPRTAPGPELENPQTVDQRAGLGRASEVAGPHAVDQVPCAAGPEVAKPQNSDQIVPVPRFPYLARQQNGS
jgi:hypothetical protein